jgi:mono/diheme cytochrome c family protein
MSARRRRRGVLVWALIGFVCPLAVAWGAERTITLPADDAYAALKEGPGAQTTRNSCGFCHSTDYIVMQPGGDAKQWQGVVTKMVNVYKAPISEADAKAIVEYLASAYGPAR